MAEAVVPHDRVGALIVNQRRPQLGREFVVDRSGEVHTLDLGADVPGQRVQHQPGIDVLGAVRGAALVLLHLEHNRPLPGGYPA